MSKDLLKKLGLDPDSLSKGEAKCPASKEVHQICEWIACEIEAMEPDYIEAVRDMDHVRAANILVIAEALYETAVAIHDGAHLRD